MTAPGDAPRRWSAEAPVLFNGVEADGTVPPRATALLSETVQTTLTA